MTEPTTSAAFPSARADENPTPTASSTTGLTVEEMVQSLTGFDEIAIEQHFGGFDVYADGERKGVCAMRALAFVFHRRCGSTDRDALKLAQNLPFSELLDYFEPEPEDLNPDEPDSPAGKGSTPPA